MKRKAEFYCILTQRFVAVTTRVDFLPRIEGRKQRLSKNLEYLDLLWEIVLGFVKKHALVQPLELFVPHDLLNRRDHLKPLLFKSPLRLNEDSIFVKEVSLPSCKCLE